MALPIEELQKRFNPKAANNVCASYLFQISGERGGNWLARINKGTLELTTVEPSAQVSPDCTISASSEDLEMIIEGKMSAMTAAMSGMLNIDGELSLAMQLVPIFFEGQSANLL